MKQHKIPQPLQRPVNREPLFLMATVLLYGQKWWRRGERGAHGLISMFCRAGLRTISHTNALTYAAVSSQRP